MRFPERLHNSLIYANVQASGQRMEGLGGGKFLPARQAAALRRLAAGQFKFLFLDLWIKFGKIISKVC